MDVDWSAPLLFENPEDRFSRVEAPYVVLFLSILVLSVSLERLLAFQERLREPKVSR